MALYKPEVSTSSRIRVISEHLYIDGILFCSVFGKRLLVLVFRDRRRIQIHQVDKNNF